MTASRAAQRRACRLWLARIRRSPAGIFPSAVGARTEIMQDLQPKLDGCALRQRPDAPPSGEVRDWIINCAVQDQVSPLLKKAEAALGILIGK